MKFINEFKDGSRTAIIYEKETSDYHISLKDTYYNYEGSHTVSNLENAEDFASAWVQLD